MSSYDIYKSSIDNIGVDVVFESLKYSWENLY